MCNSIEIQRAVTLERCKALFLGGAALEHVLGVAWNAGFCEADRDTGASDDSEFDRRVDEINREMEAIESGSVEPPAIGWLGEFPVDQPSDEAAAQILLANLRAGCGR